MRRPKYISKVSNIPGAKESEKKAMEKVTEKYRFLSNSYYLSLIDWDDPEDPIRRLIVPHPEELSEWGKIDPSNEQDYTIMPGLQHKYASTAVLLVSKACGGICRYCFRKRLFLGIQSDILRDFDAACNYIKEHEEITNVLLTGGDPLMLSTKKLDNMIEALFKLDHIGIVRLGTKMLSFDPYRVVNDPSFSEMIARHKRTGKRIYVVTHFSHPRELTQVASRAVYMLQEAGAILVNQTPLIRGVNDNPHVLAQLFRSLSFLGVAPYYVFQCRPALGNMSYAVSIEEAYDIFETAKTMVSGLAKRAKYVMSHVSGKLEMVGKGEKYMYFKYHRAAKDEDSGKFVIAKRNPEAYWFDDYETIIDEFPIGWANTQAVAV